MDGEPARLYGATGLTDDTFHLKHRIILTNLFNRVLNTVVAVDHIGIIGKSTSVHRSSGNWKPTRRDVRFTLLMGMIEQLRGNANQTDLKLKLQRFPAQKSKDVTITFRSWPYSIHLCL